MSISASRQNNQIMPHEFRTDPVQATEDRRSVAKTISQLLWSLHCREEKVRAVRLDDVSRSEAERFIEMGEMAVQAVLHPTLERTAVMAAADLLVRDRFLGDRPFAIASISDEQQARYFKLTQALIRAYRQTLAFDSPDPHLDRQYDDRLAMLEQKGLVSS